jgi:subtilisin family serine protease
MGLSARAVTIAILSLVTGLVSFSVLTPPSTAKTGGSLAERLEAAAARGGLDQEVLEALRDRGSVDALVAYDGEPIRQAAKRRAQASASRSVGASRRSDPAAVADAKARAILSVTVPNYRNQKARVLAAAGPDVQVLRDYPALPEQLVRLRSLDELAELLAHPEVASIQANHMNQAALDESLPLIRQPQAASGGHTGANMSVAVLDTGVNYHHPAFGSCEAPGGDCKVVVARDFANDDGQVDDDGHGTNVAGIVAGVAPDAKLLALDVFGADGASDADIIAAIDWVVRNQATYNISSMNLSLGWHGTHFTSECTFSAYAGPFHDAGAVGIVPVVSAGNAAIVDGVYQPGVSHPACAPGAMRVGAVYDADLGRIGWGEDPYDCVDETTAAEQIPCFSQGGPMVSIYAPGAMITAAGITEGGTSQAAPHVAGAVAVLAAASPWASVNAVANAIAGSGPAFTDPRDGDLPTTGFPIYHRLDLPAALETLAKGAIISNGTVQLGVNPNGDLNVPGDNPSSLGFSMVGLRYVPTNADAVGPGCPCEGWGVADASSSVTGYANESAGTSDNLTPLRFLASADRAISVVRVGSTFEVTQDYHPSPSTPNLYEVTVGIKNISGGPVGDLRYRRVMDWDVEPTPFDEFVTIDKGTSSAVRFTSDDGFATADPLAGDSQINFTGNATDNGPEDHGALIDLGFGALPDGATKTFNIYYGAAATERDARTALEAVHAEAYSFGQPNTPDGPTLGTPNTFIFAFNGVGGTAIARPVVTAVSPASRGQGALDEHITVSGMGFKPGASVAFSGSGIRLQSTTVVGPEQIDLVVSVDVDATVTTSSVTVTNPDGTQGSCPSCFLINRGPRLTTVKPNSLRHGATKKSLQLNGGAFRRGAVVQFAGSDITILGTPTFVDTARLQVKVSVATNAPPGFRTVTVVNPDGGRGSCTSCLRIT